MKDITTIGIDLAKNSFAVVGLNRRGKVVLRKTLRRHQLLAFIAQCPESLIGLEACSGAHYWGREFSQLGHTVGIMAAKYVAPYRLGDKNDHNDAMAIAEAVSRPNVRFVPIKSVDQQAVLCIHRIRQGLIKERTGLINQLRGLLSEFGHVMPTGRQTVQRTLLGILEDGENGLPDLARDLLSDLNSRIHQLTDQIERYDRHIHQSVKHNDQAQRLMSIPGVGSLIASGVVASVPDPHEFKNARQLAAWLGLVPRQYTTGGKVRLGRITKRGNTYLRTCLVHGARSVIAALGDKQDRVVIPPKNNRSFE